MSGARARGILSGITQITPKFGGIVRRSTAKGTASLPNPLTSGTAAKGRFGNQDFRFVAEEDTYFCPAGERSVYHSVLADLRVLMSFHPNADLDRRGPRIPLLSE